MSVELDQSQIAESVVAASTDAERLQALTASGVDTLIIGAPDVNGEFRTKRFALNLFTREEVEVAFSDYLFGCDIEDELMVPRSGYTGYFPTEATGLPDIFMRPDWSQLRVLPWDPRTALILGDYYTHHGEEIQIAPRAVLRRVVERLRGMGYEPMGGSEFEFLVFRCTPEEAKANPKGLVPLSSGPAYSHTRAASDEEVLGMVRRMMDAAGVPVEAANPEAVAGQSEITIRYSNALQAADNGFLLKHFVRELLAKQGLTASFLAKYDPSGYGSSGHLHMSLREIEADGRPALVDEEGELSEIARFAIGGFLSTLREFIGFYAPTVNSYRRYQKDHAWAGDTVSWGMDNRSCSARVIHTSPGGTRIESRVPGADMNPYIALAASLAAIGHGIEKQIEPPAPIEGDAYARNDIEKVPNSLFGAVEGLDRSEVARDWLGDDFVNFYAETRFWEAEQHRLAVTEWELSRYI